MKKTTLFFTTFLLLILACHKQKFDTNKNSILEDFEEVSSLDELISSENWEYYQQTEDENYLAIDSVFSHSGNQCLKIFAVKGNISKSDLANNKMTFWENDVVQATVWYYLEGDDPSGFLFIFDIEENIPVGATPGIRLARDDEGFLFVDRTKIGRSSIKQENQSEIIFPRNQWVEVKLEIKLERKKTGYIKVWQDNILLLQAENTQTLPKDRLYFTQGTKGMYQSIQVGITASTAENDVSLYIDDISVGVQ